ncbi:MAG: PocR ligand-binding domain-containing protein [Opitutaceae bacterium]|nr:PocR ligand-binding domain-containing protein [Opitutaceae bacterium]
MSPESSSPLWSALSESAMFRDYQAAFEKATGLPLSIHPPGTDHESGSMDRPAVGNTFCALMARTNRSCEACLALQRKLEEEAKLQPKTLKCFAGLCETAVPVRMGEGLIAFLQTGRILIESPNQRQFSKTTRELLRLGTEIDLKQLEEAYYATRVLAPDQYESMVRLLTIFAGHLAAAGNQLALQRSAPEDSPVSRARKIIDEGYREELSLGEVAGRVNVSAGYFSMMFKKVTGLNFGDYVARLRVEKAKNLLQNPKFRISEVAYEVGFQSLSQFNRTFRRILGASPRAWRATLGVSTKVRRNRIEVFCENGG